MRFWIKTLGLGILICVPVALVVAQNKFLKDDQPNIGSPRFDAARFLKDHDKNNDGKLSKDELPATAQKDFEQIDTNKDGFITQDELERYAAAIAQQRPQLVEVVFYAIDIPEEPATIQELQAAYDQLRKLDKNQDGKIDQGELKTMREERKKEQLDGIFEALDRNHDGKISKDEARGFWADNFSQLDKNGDGFLDRQEIEAACALNAQQGLSETGQLNKK